MSFPENLFYTKEHEWLKIEGNHAWVGITDHAQSSLGDIVYCELPEVGKTLTAGETFGVVESIKAVSDLYSPISGKVVEKNESVIAEPAKLNLDPYGDAWLLKVEGSFDTKSLMNPKQYEEFVKSL